MASIFTFDPNPPRVSSPWAAVTSGSSSHDSISEDHTITQRYKTSNKAGDDSAEAELPIVDHTTLTRIEAEPQEGPVEYKLHLLLRKRRSFLRSSTNRHVSGSLRRSDLTKSGPVSRSISESNLLGPAPPPLSATQSRYHRLEQLTTQMLWRLQQSSPHHTSSSNDGVIVQIPDESQLSGPVVPERLYPGLEESNGALYEIGVADNGELVGLADDEMEESLNNLRAMAASLGCRVELKRMFVVGECEWIEHSGTSQKRLKKSDLLVAEAFIRPDQHFERRHKSSRSAEVLGSVGYISQSTNVLTETTQASQQLRISLTGATMSGKSSLLGTLSTGTLDNGRGKSRLNLLKHRHEIESGGITSSITQELIGYHDVLDEEGTRIATKVINYANASSWVDIHASAEASTEGRLVFLTDSAGHPRFRRTTVRGLVGWDPHYTLLCIPADNSESSSGKIGASPSTKEILGAGVGDLDLSHEHLQLCLALELPLVVVITKYDLASLAGLRDVLSSIRTALNEAGRKMALIADPSNSTIEAALSEIPSTDLAQAIEKIGALHASPTTVVPIVLTSAVKGTGLSKLHAILRELPVPSPTTAPQGFPNTVFDIEDLYSKKGSRYTPDESTIVGGHLRYGTLKIGDELLLGPYPIELTTDDSDSGSGRPSARNSPVPTSRSFPGALHKRSMRSNSHGQISSAARSVSSVEWRRVCITSIRNLRQPVHALDAGQVGTVGVISVDKQVPISSPSIHRIRKGMVLVNGEPKASRVLCVRFVGRSIQAASTLSIGSAVVIYTASVRASSKVISIAQEGQPPTTGILPNGDENDDEGFGFGLDLDGDDGIMDSASESQSGKDAATVVTFQFIASRELVEANAKVLIMPGGGPGLIGSTERGEKGMAGLEGFVGHVVLEES
ncbi:unnamed protein product [Periconia digitata]|uniref:Tr-type G domain-containing protein n=1 Tax=Periconia digitata TaxID=1303443 RepID=A0A9W4ULK0_9PLEO|nr:unnamed protein product [Periconia digitata]